MEKIIFISLFFLIFLQSRKLWSQENCIEFLQYGLYEEYNSTTINYEYYYNLLTESNFESIEEFNKVASGLNLTIPIKGIPFQGGGEFENEAQKVKAYQHYLKTEHKTFIYEYLKKNDRLISEKITDLVRHCLDNKQGLQLWIKKGVTNDYFTIAGRFIAKGNKSYAMIRNFTIVPPEYEIIGHNELAKGEKIRGSIREVTVKKLSPQKNYEVSITSDEDTNWNPDGKVLADIELPVFSFNPTLESNGGPQPKGKGSNSFTILNNKNVNVIAKLTVTFNLFNVMWDDHDCYVEEVKIIDDQNSQLLDNVSVGSFNTVSKGVSAVSFIRLKKGEEKRITWQIGTWNSLSEQTNVIWKLEY